MAIDALQVQLTSAIQRFNALQRRIGADSESGPPKLVTRMVKELENALEEVRVAQEQLIDNHRRMEELQLDLNRQYTKYWKLFDEMPQAYLVTREDSVIMEVNRAASVLFNVSQRFLVGKTLSVFVGDDRAEFLAETSRVAQAGGPIDMNFRLRPRERAAVQVRARVAADDGALRWVIVPVDAVSAAGFPNSV